MDLVSGRYILVYIKFLAKVRKNPVIQRDFLWILTIICGFHWPDALFASFYSADSAKVGISNGNVGIPMEK